LETVQFSAAVNAVGVLYIAYAVGWRVVVRLVAQGRRVETESGGPPSPSFIGYSGSFLGIKAAGMVILPLMPI